MKKIGRYEILEELGRGAMGVVYKASDPTISRLVAIKVLSLGPTGEGLPDAREIFLREARAAGRLSHPGIVTIHDALEDTETGSSYIVMEFVPGRTLESLLLSGSLTDVTRALEITRQIAEALDYAHREKVIHRDLKPANILLTEDGRSKITDFGIAKIAAREGALRSAAVMGTPSYMSPEQVKGKEIDNRTDLFSLGVILFMMLTGQKPFVGDTAAVMFKIVYEDAVPPSKLNPKLTLGHDYLALRCLAKEPKKRYSTAGEFLDDLRDVEEGRSPRSQAQVSLSDLRPGEPTVMVSESLGTTRVIPHPAFAAMRLWRAIGIGAGSGLIVVLAALGLSNLRHRAPGARPAAVQTAPVPARAVPVTSASGAPQGASRTAPAVTGQGAFAPGTPSPGPAATSRAPSGPAEYEILLQCRYELREATLIVSAGGRRLQRSLIGNKKGGFLGIKPKYEGELTLRFKVPRGARDLRVHVVTPDGVDRPGTVKVTPSGGSRQVFELDVTRDHLTLARRASAPPPS